MGLNYYNLLLGITSMGQPNLLFALISSDTILLSLSVTEPIRLFDFRRKTLFGDNVF